MHQDHYHSLQAWMSDVEIQVRHEVCPLFTGKVSVKEMKDRSYSANMPKEDDSFKLYHLKFHNEFIQRGK